MALAGGRKCVNMFEENVKTTDFRLPKRTSLGVREIVNLNRIIVYCSLN